MLNTFLNLSKKAAIYAGSEGITAVNTIKKEFNPQRMKFDLKKEAILKEKKREWLKNNKAAARITDAQASISANEEFEAWRNEMMLAEGAAETEFQETIVAPAKEQAKQEATNKIMTQEDFMASLTPQQLAAMVQFSKEEEANKQEDLNIEEMVKSSDAKAS